MAASSQRGSPHTSHLSRLHEWLVRRPHLKFEAAEFKPAANRGSTCSINNLNSTSLVSTLSSLLAGTLPVNIPAYYSNIAPSPPSSAGPSSSITACPTSSITACPTSLIMACPSTSPVESPDSSQTSFQDKRRKLIQQFLDGCADLLEWRLEEEEWLQLDRCMSYLTDDLAKTVQHHMVCHPTSHWRKRRRAIFKTFSSQPTPSTADESSPHNATQPPPMFVNIN